MLKDVDTPEATAMNKAEINKAKKERFERVSFNSPTVRPRLKACLGGGCFKNGICRCVPALETMIEINIMTEAVSP